MNNDILSSIPHRPPFLFIDELVEVRDDGATGRRTLRADEAHFAGHYPGNPIMPGVLLCEAVFQTAAAFLAQQAGGDVTSGGRLTPILSRIENAKFKRRAVPGDELLIEVRHREKKGGFTFMSGKIMKEGQVVMTVDFALAMVEES